MKKRGGARGGIGSLNSGLGGGNLGNSEFVGSRMGLEENVLQGAKKAKRSTEQSPGEKIGGGMTKGDSPQRVSNIQKAMEDEIESYDF